MFRIACLIGGYFIGCIQTAYFVSRAMGVDLKHKGSGNLGTTNATRVMGKKAGAITFAGDVLKTVAAFLIFSHIFKSNYFMAGMYASLGVILGHDFPFYLKFSGGKGIAAMLGFLLCVGTKPALFVYACGIIGALTGYVSIGSLFIAVSIPVALYIFGYGTEAVCIGIVMCLLAVWRHRSNFKRIKNGTESRLKLFRK